MKKIEFTASAMVAGKQVTSIEVNGITFMQFYDVWSKSIAAIGVKQEVALQRGRIKKQTVFKAGADVLELSDTDLMQLPFQLTKDIIAALDDGEGVAGKIIVKGDIATSPVIYKLGTPFAMKNGDTEISVSELEFSAKTYADVEDVLVADSSLSKTVMLVTKLAKPIEVPSLMQLPGWMVDRLTIADGFTIMKEVLPLF